MEVNYVKVYQKNSPAYTLTTLTPGDEQPGGSLQELLVAELTFDGHIVKTNESADFTIYNMSGALVATAYGTQITIADLPAGIYVVKAITSSGKTATKKISVR